MLLEEKKVFRARWIVVRVEEAEGVIVLEVWFKLYNSRSLKPGWGSVREFLELTLFLIDICSKRRNCFSKKVVQHLRNKNYLPIENNLSILWTILYIKIRYSYLIIWFDHPYSLRNNPETNFNYDNHHTCQIHSFLRPYL